MTGMTPIQYSGLPSPEPWCYRHDFTRATHTCILLGSVVDLCTQCGTTMGGRAFGQQPRPFYAGELEHRAAMIRLDRKLDRMAAAAVARIEQPTPTEVDEYLAEAQGFAAAFKPLMEEWAGDVRAAAIDVARGYQALWGGLIAAFEEREES